MPYQVFFARNVIILVFASHHTPKLGAWVRFPFFVVVCKLEAFIAPSQTVEFVAKLWLRVETVAFKRRSEPLGFEIGIPALVNIRFVPVPQWNLSSELAGPFARCGRRLSCIFREPPGASVGGVHETRQVMSLVQVLLPFSVIGPVAWIEVAAIGTGSESRRSEFRSIELWRAELGRSVRGADTESSGNHGTVDMSTDDQGDERDSDAWSDLRPHHWKF